MKRPRQEDYPDTMHGIGYNDYVDALEKYCDSLENKVKQLEQMKYLITTSDGETPYFTEWYTHENCFNADTGMVVHDLVNRKYTNDGTQWQPIEEDHL